MKKKIIYIFTVIISVFLGATSMYLVIYHFPLDSDSIASSKNKVTVTDKGISEGIQNIYGAVVVIENYSKSKLIGIGSGFIYDEEGYIMTNHHVIEGADSIKVITMNSETITAELLGSDEYADIAVLKIDKKYAKDVAVMGKSEETSIGDTVFTIGSPMSSDYAGTVTRGILSGKNRMVEVAVGSSSSNDWIMNVMQTDAAINPGNSGGPLCNVNGEVIGINSMKIVQSSVEGIGFAIPIEDALIYAEKIVSGEELKRAYLGIQMSDLSTPSYYLQGISIDSSIVSGVIVVDVIDKGPSKQAGIQKGDVINKIGSYSVKNVAELRYYLYKHEPNETVEIELIRGKTSKKVNVKLGES
ncbi:MAG: PDZ domain-containing protein [Tenericutes bacterium]|nr:PDZ domain-containing protein [Mycoplasmatota bacterium]